MTPLAFQATGGLIARYARVADGGKTLLAGQVQNLVNAMAAFAPPAAGQTSLSPAYAAALNPVIAANWQ